MIAGLEKADAGEIIIDNQLVYSHKRNIFLSPDKRKISLVFQNYALWPHYNIFDNIAYPLKIRKEKKDIIKKKVRSVLALVKLSDTEERYPAELSGGEQQRVALARALVMEPKLLLLDEPLSNLDAKLREKMQYEIKRIQQKMNLSIIHVTHDQDEAMGIADRIAVMKEGEIIQKGTPEEVYRRPSNQFVASFIGKINIIDSDFILNLTKDVKPTKDKLNKLISNDKYYFIRPEEIKISNREGLAKACIIERIYLGNSLEYRLKVNNKILIVQTAFDERYEVGDEVYIDFSLKYIKN